jgi:hypothetical protein
LRPEIISASSKEVGKQSYFALVNLMYEKQSSGLKAATVAGFIDHDVPHRLCAE